MAGHPSVEELGGHGVVLDGKVSEGHFCIWQIMRQSWIPRQGSQEFRVEAAVVEGFEEQAQEVAERQCDEQREGVRLSQNRVPVTPPSGQQDSFVYGDEGMVDDAPASGPTLRYIKPAEVPNQPYGGPVEPLSTSTVHEVSLLSPGP